MRLAAPPFHILVERDELPEKVGHLILPPGYRQHTIAATGTITSVGVLCASNHPRSGNWAPGDRILMSPSAGKRIEFEGEVLWKVRPEHILLSLGSEVMRATVHDPHPNRAFPDSQRLTEPDLLFDEGDPTGLR
jgi:co-chaperonin GroES (HSP10)